MSIYGIVGSAGRTCYISKDQYQKMIDVLPKYLPGNSIVYSGGASFADHIAVLFYLADQISTLYIYAPCNWDFDKKEFYDNGMYDWRTNPGRTANMYHRKFSNVIGRNSLFDIDNAVKKGAKYIVKNGFHDRNSEIAKCDILIAYSFGIDEPNDGGTLDTWRKCGGKKIHISINNL